MILGLILYSKTQISVYICITFYNNDYIAELYSNT